MGILLKWVVIIYNIHCELYYAIKNCECDSHMASAFLVNAYL